MGVDTDSKGNALRTHLEVGVKDFGLEEGVPLARESQNSPRNIYGVLIHRRECPVYGI